MNQSSHSNIIAKKFCQNSYSWQIFRDRQFYFKGFLHLDQGGLGACWCQPQRQNKH